MTKGERLHLTETKTCGRDMSFESCLKMIPEAYLWTVVPVWRPEEASGLANSAWLLRFLKVGKVQKHSGLEMAQEYSGAGYRSRSSKEWSIAIPNLKWRCQLAAHITSRSPQSPFLCPLIRSLSEVFRRHRFFNCCSPDWVLVEQLS